MNTNDYPSHPLAAVSFYGADAAHFLQGQLTINTETLAAGEWRRAAYCSRQGRMLANGLLLHLPADAPYFLFIMSADIAEAVAAMLRRYVLRAKVTVALPALQISVTAADGLAPVLPGGTVDFYEQIARIDEGGGLRWTVAVDAPLPPDSGGAESGLSPAVWQRGEIERGVAWVSEKTQDNVLPQFVNYELIGGVDFEKGCFVGQEVIARLHHLGAVKRRGMMISAAAGNVPAAGEVLRTAAGKPAGEVVNSVALAEGDAAAAGFIGFAAVGKDAGELLIGDEEAVAAATAIPLTVQPPPYPIIEHEKFQRR